jgi:hypothetical protein
MRAVSGGNGVSLTVPIGNPNLSTGSGSAVQWDKAKALTLFRALRDNNTESIRVLAKEQEALRNK